MSYMGIKSHNRKKSLPLVWVLDKAKTLTNPCMIFLLGELKVIRIWGDSRNVVQRNFFKFPFFSDFCSKQGQTKRNFWSELDLGTHPAQSLRLLKETFLVLEFFTGSINFCEVTFRLYMDWYSTPYIGVHFCWISIYFAAYDIGTTKKFTKEKFYKKNSKDKFSNVLCKKYFLSDILIKLIIYN